MLGTDTSVVTPISFPTSPRLSASPIGIATALHVFDPQIDRPGHVAQRKQARNADQAILVEDKLRRMEANDREARHVEHVLPAQPRIAHTPARIDCRRVDDEVHRARVLFGVDGDRPFHATEAAVLRRQSEVTDREFGRREFGIDAIVLGRRDGRSSSRKDEQCHDEERDLQRLPIRDTPRPAG